MQVLARIARCGKPSDRRRAAELIGKQFGMFRDKGSSREVTLEELVLGAGRRRLPEGAVRIEVVDPYVRRQDNETSSRGGHLCLESQHEREP